MRLVRTRGLAAACAAAALLVWGCGGSPSTPGGVPPPPGGGGTPPPPPPSNNAPTIQSISVKGTRPNEPANFADAGETVQVTADVKDDETPVAQLQYNWSAPTGTFSGTGANVTWQAPADVPQPTEVVVKLEVVEKYGTAGAFENRVSATAAVSLHDSIREVGGMARQFLLDFSDSSIRDVDYIMRNFGSAATCPDVREVEGERDDVTDDRREFQILNSRIGDPRVTVNFGGVCPYLGKAGDACAVVPSYWQSRELATGVVGAVDGDDIVAAAYSKADKRWWLCASSYDSHPASGAPLRGFRSVR
jgi:hypothetical protein